MRIQRGGAFIYAILIVTSITAFILVSTMFAVQMRKLETRREQSSVAVAAFEGMVAKLSADRAKGVLMVPSDTTTTLGNATVRMLVTDSGATIARTAKVDATITVSGYDYRMSTYIAGRDAGLYSNAIAVNGALSTSSTVVTGALGVNGSISANGPIALSGLGSTINGDADSTSTVGPTSLVVLGEKRTYQTPKTFPALNSGSYLAVAAATRNQGNLNNYTFPVVTSSQSYPVLYVNGDLTFKGTITNRGTIYVKGNLTYNGDANYANSSSRVAFIVEGTATIGSFNVVGYHYVAGATTVNGTGTRSITLGNLVASSLTISRNLNVTLDPAVRNDSNEGVRHRLPDYWP